MLGNNVYERAPQSLFFMISEQASTNCFYFKICKVCTFRPQNDVVLQYLMLKADHFLRVLIRPSILSQFALMEARFSDNLPPT